MIFITLIGVFFIQTWPPKGVLDENDKILPGMEEKYKKYEKRERIKHIIGYIVAFLLICICIVYINLQAAVLGEEATNIWFYTFIFGLLDDIFIVQPLKCLIYFLCTKQSFVRILFEICSGALHMDGSLTHAAILE